MKRHPLIGERILAAAPDFGGAAKLVRSSHERWDGTGYPDRLSGPEIPLGARIISVCDAFDAMTTTRPYAPQLGSEDAIERARRVARERSSTPRSWPHLRRSSWIFTPHLSLKPA